MCVLVAGLQACGGGGGGGGGEEPAPERPSDAEVANAVTTWNQAIRSSLDASSGFDAADEPKLYAYVAVAVHDALNSIDRRFERYYDDAPQGPASADPRAAVARATRDVLLALLPAGGDAATEARYQQAIAALDAGPARDDGVAVGAAAAQRVLSDRGTDLSLSEPWVVTSATQFRPPPPYGIADSFPLDQPARLAQATTTPQYAADFNEVKCLGRGAPATIADCTVSRTAEQTAIGHFWAEDSSVAWNRIATTLIGQTNADGWTAARTYALMHLVLVDVGLVNSNSKAHYNFWRPEEAVAEAADDGNADTDALAGWQPLRPTPATPDYPSAHAANGNAAQAVLAHIFGNGVSFSTTSTSDSGNAMRSFDSLSDAAAENAVSRVYIGYHFRHATEAGAAQGTQVGQYVLDQVLEPVP